MTPSGTPLSTIAVILVNWNGRDVTLECLRSLRNVTTPGLHIIVVDNGSDDGSVEAIRNEFPAVEILPQRENLRFAGGNNVGIRRALDEGASFIVLLNNDTTVDPDFARVLSSRLHSDPGCGMAAPKIYYYDAPDKIWFAGGEISFWTGTMKHTGIREKDDSRFNEARTIDYASGCCMMVRSEVIAKVGMLDEAYFIYGEDADWCMRIRNAGYTIWYEPAAKVWHKLSVSAGGHLSTFKLKNKYFGSLRFFARYAKWYHWLTWPWLSVVVNGVAGIRYGFQVKNR